MKDQRTYDVIGAAMEVHRQLGHGFLEAVYQEALANELSERGILFQREAELIVRYKGKALSCEYRADFLCYEAVVVELKAVSIIVSAHHAQLINELKATGFHIGLLLNFGAASLEHRRFIHSDQRETLVDFLTASQTREDEAEYCLAFPPPIFF